MIGAKTNDELFDRAGNRRPFFILENAQADLRDC